MAKEIILYQGLHNWSAESLINELNAHMNEEVVIRLNSPGGDVFASYGIMAKIAEHGDVTIKVDGIAASAAFIALMYANKVYCLDVSTFMAHRAASYSNDPEAKKLEAVINADLRKKILSRVDEAKWKEITGTSIEEMFNADTRVNVWLNAKQMKDLGIVSKIVKLTPAEGAAVSAAWAIAASAEDPNHAPKPSVPPTKKPEPEETMKTLAELMAQNPALYALAIAEGVKKERDRVGSFLAYAEADPKRVAEAVAKGEEMTETLRSELSVAQMSAVMLGKLKKDSKGEVKTPAGTPNPGADAKPEVTEFEHGVRAMLGLDKEKKVA